MNTKNYTFRTKGYENPAEVLNNKREVLATVYTDVEGGDQYDTAKLFAAAPDLLIALNELVDATLIGMPHDPVWVATAHAKARAAITKATQE